MKLLKFTQYLQKHVRRAFQHPIRPISSTTDSAGLILGLLLAIDPEFIFISATKLE